MLDTQCRFLLAKPSTENDVRRSSRIMIPGYPWLVLRNKTHFVFFFNNYNYIYIHDFNYILHNYIYMTITIYYITICYITIYIYIYFIVIYIYIYILVGGEPYPSEKWWSSSVGMMKFPVYGTIKAMFQITNQYICVYNYEGWWYPPEN